MWKHADFGLRTDSLLLVGRRAIGFAKIARAESHLLLTTFSTTKSSSFPSTTVHSEPADRADFLDSDAIQIRSRAQVALSCDWLRVN
jgi:hypothetical protein